MNSKETQTDLQIIKDKLKNKQRIRLQFPYSENAEVKKLGAKYNTDKKMWYYPSLDGELPEDLKKYKAHFLDIEYEDKEYFKTVFPSMRFDKLEKKWYINQMDYDKFSQGT